MTKHEADVIGGLNMTDQISNEAYKQIMIAAQEENEVGDTLDKIKDEIEQTEINGYIRDVECFSAGINVALNVINKYRNEVNHEAVS